MSQNAYENSINLTFIKTRQKVRTNCIRICKMVEVLCELAMCDFLDVHVELCGVLLT